MSPLSSSRRWILGVATVLVVAGGVVVASGDDSAPAPATTPCGPRDTWVAPQVRQGRNRFRYRPMTDSAAAACVVPRPEAVPINAKPNKYVPSDRELRAYRSARNEDGETPKQYMYYAKFVTGRPGMTRPTTDELIQWGSYKWGIPTDWLRAQYVQESHWRQDNMGDLAEHAPAWHSLFPAFSCPNADQCYESLGITQVKWQPWNDEGTEPLRWKSTAFNIDYQAAKLRFYYDNPFGKRSAWGDRSYRPREEWMSICGWFQPYPWRNSDQRSYCSDVRRHLAARDWPR